ncbi:MAG: phosphate ABC transporter ATP-binding protein, partial [Streptomycetaceae bacterium]
MTTSHESEHMETTVKPSSLASVAQAKPIKTPGTRAMGTGLETRGVHAWFGKHHALSNISLDFAAGTVT